MRRARTTLERREAEARVAHNCAHNRLDAVTNLSVAYAVCKTKEGGLGGSPKEKSFGTPRVSFSKNLLFITAPAQEPLLFMV